MNFERFILTASKAYRYLKKFGHEKSLEAAGRHNISTHQEGITCTNLNIAYNSHIAIQDLSGTFQSGTLTAVIGPNGGGKSTLLKTIKGFIRPSSGAITRNGIPLSQITYLSQNSEIDRSFPLSVKDVVAMGLCSEVGFFRHYNRTQCEKIMQALDSVGLLECADRALHTLSGGQFQRVLFARMALQNAPIVLLDEPFAAIDSSTMEALAQLLCKWQQQGRTIIVVLHDLDIVREFFPKTLVLARQSIAWGDTKETLTLDNLRKAKFYSHNWDNNELEAVPSTWSRN
ncbi:MAG: ABC transporter ATP-binding protein [Alphaproteobacteria bacterium]|nr:ABC transporter ATP-binding protein [Alphaproteobacteria bacterium]